MASTVVRSLDDLAALNPLNIGLLGRRIVFEVRGRGLKQRQGLTTFCAFSPSRYYNFFLQVGEKDPLDALTPGTVVEGEVNGVLQPDRSTTNVFLNFIRLSDVAIYPLYAINDFDYCSQHQEDILTRGARVMVIAEELGRFPNQCIDTIFNETYDKGMRFIVNYIPSTAENIVGKFIRAYVESWSETPYGIAVQCNYVNVSEPGDGWVIDPEKVQQRKQSREKQLSALRESEQVLFDAVEAEKVRREEAGEADALGIDINRLRDLKSRISEAQLLERYSLHYEFERNGYSIARLQIEFPHIYNFWERITAIMVEQPITYAETNDRLQQMNRHFDEWMAALSVVNPSYCIYQNWVMQDGYGNKCTKMNCGYKHNCLLCGKDHGLFQFTVDNNTTRIYRCARYKNYLKSLDELHNSWKIKGDYWTNRHFLELFETDIPYILLLEINRLRFETLYNMYTKEYEPKRVKAEKWRKLHFEGKLKSNNTAKLPDLEAEILSIFAKIRSHSQFFRLADEKMATGGLTAPVQSYQKSAGGATQVSFVSSLSFDDSARIDDPTAVDRAATVADVRTKNSATMLPVAALPLPPSKLSTIDQSTALSSVESLLPLKTSSPPHVAAVAGAGLSLASPHKASSYNDDSVADTVALSAALAVLSPISSGGPDEEAFGTFDDDDAGFDSGAKEVSFFEKQGTLLSSYSGKVGNIKKEPVPPPAAATAAAATDTNSDDDEDEDYPTEEYRIDSAGTRIIIFNKNSKFKYTSGTDVYEARMKNTITGREERIVVKLFPVEKKDKEEKQKLLRTELQVLDNIDSVHVVRYLATTEIQYPNIRGCPKFLTVIMKREDMKLIEYMQEIPDDDSYMESARPLMRQLVLGYLAIHARNIIHRDVKPDNILVSVSHTGGALIKICDFGLSKMHDAMLQRTQGNTVSGAGATSVSGNTYVGTIYNGCWVAPEVLVHYGGHVDPSRYTKASDLWPLGLVFYYIASRGLCPIVSGEETDLAVRNSNARIKLLSRSRAEIDAANRIATHTGFGRSISHDKTTDSARLNEDCPLLFDLVERMVRPFDSVNKNSPLNRLTLEGVAAHPFFWEHSVTSNIVVNYIGVTNNEKARSKAFKVDFDGRCKSYLDAIGGWDATLPIFANLEHPETYNKKSAHALLLAVRNVLQHTSIGAGSSSGYVSNRMFKEDVIATFVDNYTTVLLKFFETTICGRKAPERPYGKWTGQFSETFSFDFFEDEADTL